MKNDKTIKPTCDRKTRFHTNQQNTSGLLPGLAGTCPGCTTAKGGCGYVAPGRKVSVCYVDGLMRCYKGIKGVLTHNTVLLRSLTPDEKIAVLDAEFKRFETAERRYAAKMNCKPALYYRLHWSGDIFSLEYAEALKSAMLLNPNINFWTYTRTWYAVPVLCRVPNLQLYLSLDPVNVLSGLVTYDEVNGPSNSNLKLCYMSPEDDFHTWKPRALELLEARNEVRKLIGAPIHSTAWLAKLALKVCPVDANTSKLIKGCADCKACLAPGTAPVWFKC